MPDKSKSLGDTGETVTVSNPVTTNNKAAASEKDEVKAPENNKPDVKTNKKRAAFSWIENNKVIVIRLLSFGVLVLYPFVNYFFISRFNFHPFLDVILTALTVILIILAVNYIFDSVDERAKKLYTVMIIFCMVCHFYFVYSQSNYDSSNGKALYKINPNTGERFNPEKNYDPKNRDTLVWPDSPISTTFSKKTSMIEEANNNGDGITVYPRSKPYYFKLKAGETSPLIKVADGYLYDLYYSNNKNDNDFYFCLDGEMYQKGTKAPFVDNQEFSFKAGANDQVIKLRIKAK
ncbi:MAG: hypothetical protein MUF50_04130 [Planctomycetes bacterium]|jgi:hypothetical protein|nr:hypothetical protein [Planctomycetota bacterium]